MAMEMRMRPVVSTVTLTRECPSGALKITGVVGFYTPGGMRVAQTGINGYQGMEVKITDAVAESGREFLAKLLAEVEAAFRKEVKQNIAEKDPAHATCDDDDVPI